MGAIPARIANARVSEQLLEAARLLQARRSAPHRAAAYRAAGTAIARYRHDVRRVFERDGVKGLDAIPHVGLGVASAVAEMLGTGGWTQLERLRDEADAATLLQAVPGIGTGLARRIRDELRADCLDALDQAVKDGRLQSLRGVGPRRAAALRSSIDEMHRNPPVQMRLEVDSPA